MSAYTRKDSPWIWLYLESTKEKIKTDIPVGGTTQQRSDAMRLATDLYHQEMHARSARRHKLPHASRAITFAKYAEPYAADTIAHHRGHQRESEILAILRQHFDREPLTAINDRDRIRAYHTARLAAGVSARSINREVDVLKSMIRDAVPKYLAHSELAGMPRLEAAPVRRRLMSPAEERRILAVATDPQDRAILILGLDTLLRLGDLLDLKRSDRRGPWIYVGDPKVRSEAGEIPLTPRAAKALEAIPNTGPYYFGKFRIAKLPRDWRGSVRQRLEYLCDQADPPIPYGRANGGLTFHWATRRTGAKRYLVEKKVSIAVLQKLGGWKRATTPLEIYAEAERKDLLAAVGQPVRAAAGKRLRLVRQG